jgi:hypothetical protein
MSLITTGHELVAKHVLEFSYQMNLVMAWLGLQVLVTLTCCTDHKPLACNLLRKAGGFVRCRKTDNLTGAKQ